MLQGWLSSDESCFWKDFHKLDFLFSLQEYEKALKYIRILLKNEPGNKQALEMEKLIDKALKKGKKEALNGFIIKALVFWKLHPDLLPLDI